MQYSVLDKTATLFANRFYTGVANSKPIDVALAESRLALAIAAGDEGANRIHFATPVLLLNDPDCLNVSHVRAPEAMRTEGAMDFATVSVMDRGFRWAPARTAAHPEWKDNAKALLAESVKSLEETSLGLAATLGMYLAG